MLSKMVKTKQKQYFLPSIIMGAVFDFSLQYIASACMYACDVFVVLCVYCDIYSIYIINIS